MYKTPAALEMAIKQAAKDSPQDTNRAIAGFWRHRLLCRVFSNANRSFVLKGGHAMLARTVDARATRDIDLLSKKDSLDAAVEELKRLATVDLDDFATFEFLRATPIKTEDEYRSGLNVRFRCLVGAKPVQDVSIDLVVDEVALENTDVVAPADRLEVRGVEVCDYAVYPVECALADKLCGIIETHDDRVSSRVKDLADILIIATSMTVDGTKLQKRIAAELGARKLSRLDAFVIPTVWRTSRSSTYANMAKQARLPPGAVSLESAVALAKKLLDPAIQSLADGMTWIPEKEQWIREGASGDQHL